MAATPNYTDEQTTKLIEDYNEGNGKTVETLADELNKSVRSIRSKLVREGVYVAADKPAAAKKIEGPSKKELLNELDSYNVIDTDGLLGATKPAIASVLAFVQDMLDEDEQLEDEQPEVETEAA